MAEPLTPQRMADLIDAHLRLLMTYTFVHGEYVELYAALTAVLDAYRREHMRLWLERQGISASTRCGFSTWWLTCPIDRAAHEVVADLNSSARTLGWPTADEAREAAAKALGYPGLEE